MTNHKRKKKKEKKTIEYGTPKIVQQLHNEAPERIRKNKKRNKVCKYTKGEHVYSEEMSRNYYGWVNNTFVTLRCKCGKKKVEVLSGDSEIKS